VSGKPCRNTQRSERGALRLYLGAAPGVGKTYAALSEARRRAERGTDVVLTFVETYHRPKPRHCLPVWKSCLGGG
jgi:K+-sensing histidine kinase KdpD